MTAVADETETTTSETTVATLEDLLAVKPATTTIEVDAEGDGSRMLTLRFQAVSRRTVDDLIAAHPAKADDDGEYDVASFGPALIAASLIEPKLELADVQRLWNELPAAVSRSLWFAAQEVNLRPGARAAVGKGSAGTPGSAPS